MSAPIKIPLTPGSVKEINLKRYLRRRVRAVRDSLRERNEVHLPNWRRAYEAKPLEETREFPFHNASNLVVPIIAIHADTLLARVMASVVKTKPPWIQRILTDLFDDDQKPQELKELLEDFMEYVGWEPSELDLYRIYHEFFGEAIRVGTSVLKCPHVKQVEDTVVPAGDGLGQYSFRKRVIYEGPRPEKLAQEDFGIPTTAKTIEMADFKYHRRRLQRWELDERRHTGVYDAAQVASIMAFPDRTSPESTQQQKEEDSHIHTSSLDGWAEWDIYECYFKYLIDGYHNVRCIVWYHEKTDTILRAFFDYYPECIFIAGRLFYRDDMFHGYGFCETLHMIQEEDSKMHNNRADNKTIANTRVWRANVDSKLHTGYKIFPSAVLPADKDELEALTPGDMAPQDINEEHFLLDLAERRSGVNQPMQGAGAGGPSKKAPYSAMGTLSVLQEGNTRTDLNITDIKYAHTRLGRVLQLDYAEFGVGERKKLFGTKGKRLAEAFQAYKAGKIILPISASSASVNKEVEKQNALMLSTIMGKHYSMVTQMLQAATNQFTDKRIKQYLEDAISSSNLLMQSVLKLFQYDEVEDFVPSVEPPSAEPPAQAGQPAPGAGQPPPGAGQPSPQGPQGPGSPLPQGAGAGTPGLGGGPGAPPSPAAAPPGGGTIQ